MAGEGGGGGIREVSRVLTLTGQTAQEQSADSFHHTRQSLVSLRHFPSKLVRRTEHTRSPDTGRRQNAYKESRTSEQGRATGEHGPMRAKCWAAADQ